jgi:hypothetical protein
MGLSPTRPQLTLGATLTLPGLAGLVLPIGTAVDTKVQGPDVSAGLRSQDLELRTRACACAHRNRCQNLRDDQIPRPGLAVG